MALLPNIKQFLDQFNEVKVNLAAIGYKPTQANTREGLANLTRLYMTNYDKTMPTIDDAIYNGHYPVPIRIYLPKANQEALPVAAFIHGGGHMCGNITVYDGIARRLAQEIQHILISIDYRLAPEFAYPTGLQDCKAAIRGIFKTLNEHKIKYLNRELTTIGDSAGGALCASIAMDKEFVAVEQIKRQVLIYPSVDYTGASPSLTELAKGYFLEKARLNWYFENYFQNNEDRKAVSPLYNEFYANMPATLVCIAAYDPLKDEGALYYEQVVKVGANAELVQIDGVIHAYLMLEEFCAAECARTYQEINKFLSK